MFANFKRRIRCAQLGYRSGQEGIMSRYLREEGGWTSHLLNTKKVIVDALYSFQPKSVRILGSGWLLDVPMEELLSVCEQVVLVDVVHPTQILHKYKHNSKVRFENFDLNCLNDYLLSTPAKKINFFTVMSRLNQSKATVFAEDLIVSLNLLSQLNDYPITFLSKRITLNEQQKETLSQQIQSKHIASLPTGKSVLITDYEEEYDDEDGAFLGASPTVFVDIPRANTVSEWNWRFDTHFIYREDCRTTLKVLAVRL